MADLGLLGLFLRTKTPEGVRDALVGLLLDPARDLSMEDRRDLAAMLQDGLHGFELRVARTTAHRLSTDVLRNVAVYEAVNEARYRKRVGDDTAQPREWREKASLSEAEWQEIVDGVVQRHNAHCEPGDRWNPLHNQKARDQAFKRGFEAAIEYRQAQEAED